MDSISADPTIARRTLIVGSFAAATVAALGIAAFRPTEGKSDAKALLEQARILRSQNTRETQNQAIGLAREAVRQDPSNATAWGELGYAQATASRWRQEAESRSLREQATMSGQRALDLDPGNAKGELALATALPLCGTDSWLARADGIKRSLDRAPSDPDALVEQAFILRFTGHCAEAAAVCARLQTRHRTPPLYNIWIRALWSAGQSAERDRKLAEAAGLYPTNKMLWYTRFEVLAFGGRPDEAVALAQDARGRPEVVTESEAQDLVLLAAALGSRHAAQIDDLMGKLLTGARIGIRAATNALRVASLTGRLDDAFTLAQAYYFARGFTVGGELGGGLFVSQSQRHTNYLFEPPLSPMWKDRRFGLLIEELGLERYWREARKPPDFRGLAALSFPKG
ncbi:hypothetical protein ACFO0A_12625 [Novosphingobium tardum]|uniref:Tetratricopeptide repeat protein n=1 Tax=Novosphingobium tardum TaxID=1538021 RepID=A0ABV8RRK4_9SPHN